MKSLAIVFVFFGIVLAAPITLNGTYVTEIERDLSLTVSTRASSGSDRASSRWGNVKFNTQALLTQSIDNDEWIVYPDVDRDEDVVYAKRLRAAGVPCGLEVVPGAFHGFDVALPGRAVSRAFWRSQAAALHGALQPGPAPLRWS